MTTLTAGNSASFSIGPYETLTIRTGGRGSLSFTSLAENAHPSFTANVANGNYGPYGVAMQVLMTMIEGSAEYEHSGSDAGNLVTATTNLTGGISLSVGGIDITEMLVGDVPEIDAGGNDFQRPICNDGIGNIAISFDSLSNWTANLGTPTLTQGYTGFDANGNRTGVVSRTGVPEMLKVVPGTANDEIVIPTFAAVTTGGKFGLWVYLANQPGYEAGGTFLSGGSASTISLLITTHASSMSNALAVTFNHLYLREGWNFLGNENASTAKGGPGHPDGIVRTVNGDGSNADIINSPIRRLKVIFTNMSGGPELYLDSLWTGFTTRPKFVLGTDSQGSDMLDIMLPLFDSYGWTRKAYMAIPRQVLSPGDTTNYFYKTWATTKPNIDEAYDRGLHALPHSTNHQKPGALTSAARVRWEALPCQAWLAANGWVRGNNIWVSPNISSSRLSERVLKDMGFIGQRHGRCTHNTITPFGIDNPQHIGSLDIGLTTNQKYSIVKTQIDIAKFYGSVLWVFHHTIQTLGDDGSGEGLTGDALLIYKSNYIKIHEYIRSLELADEADVISPTECFHGAL